ncbi:MAG: DNA polymerase III subunit gamma/tau [Oscillospiraceae bacterium]|jgi:DNA polymerase-3 subunit gamma/tau|nr:DNA polymerase III subunit gamma/tau [Oscillospiraceae bacterium]
MATQALYRIWRSQRFSEVVGQDALVTTLRNQVASGRVAHAYLFCGSRGVGKTSVAKIFARAVNCETPEAGEPCGHCPTCRALQSDEILDISEIDAASNNGVDEIRDLRDKVKYPPQQGRYRVYIIDEVHMLSTGAFNALLKTLEEPPPHALFILATTEPQKLPATVLSRCQRYDFRRIPLQAMVGRLSEIAASEKGDVSPDALALIARTAEGGMRDAIGLLDMCLSYGGGSVDAALVREILGASDRGFLFAFTDHLISGDAAAVLADIETLMRSGREAQVFARDLTGHLRALLLAQACGDAVGDLLDGTAEDAAQYRAQAGRISRERLLALLDLFLSAENDMKWASQPRVALEVAAARGCLPEAHLQLSAMAERLDLLERRLAGGAVVAKPVVTTAPAKAVKTAPPAPVNDSLWDKAMSALKGEMPLFAFLKQGRFAGLSDDTAHLAFPKAGETYRNMLAQGGRKERVEAVLSELAGRPIALQLEVEGAATPAAKPQKSAMQAVVDLFGREHVEVVDEEGNLT